MLATAVAVLALVGGALAFKGKTFTNHKIFCNDASTGFCTVEVDGIKQQGTGGTAVTPCTGFTDPTKYELTSHSAAACTLTARVVSVSNTP